MNNLYDLSNAHTPTRELSPPQEMHFLLIYQIKWQIWWRILVPRSEGKTFANPQT